MYAHADPEWGKQFHPRLFILRRNYMKGKEVPLLLLPDTVPNQSRFFSFSEAAEWLQEKQYKDLASLKCLLVH